VISREARDHVRALMGHPGVWQSSDERKKVESDFAHLKIPTPVARCVYGAFSGARAEFHFLAAIAQNLKRRAKKKNHSGTPPRPKASCVRRLMSVVSRRVNVIPLQPERYEK